MNLYADNAATKRLRPCALEAMMPWLTDGYGNASSFYSLARDARRAMDTARRDIAQAIGALPEEIYFTAGATEADNWALKGRWEHTPGAIVTTAIEHPAIMETAHYLEKKGAKVTYVPVSSAAVIDIDALEAALTPDVTLVSVMLANNEVGAIQPIPEIAGLLTRFSGKIKLHTDAVQAVGNIPVDVRALGVDMLSLSAHKFGGPKGVGALYIKKGLRIAPLLHGGGHERGGRSGTENVAGVVGMAAALKDAVTKLPDTQIQTERLRNRLIAGILQIPHSSLSGPNPSSPPAAPGSSSNLSSPPAAEGNSRFHRPAAEGKNRLPGNASFLFRAVEGESLVLRLDMMGVSASSGSACSSGSLDPSHVLLAMGLPHEIAHGSLRLSIDETNTEEDIDEIIRAVTEVVAKQREMSPLWPIS